MFKPAALMCMLIAGVCFGAPASGARKGKLKTVPLVSMRTFTSMHMVRDDQQTASGGEAGHLYLGGDVGARIAVGQGHWRSKPKVWMGTLSDPEQFSHGYGIGAWVRSSVPSPAVDERYGQAYGLSYTMLYTSDSGTLNSLTVDAGVRFSMDANDRHTTARGNFGQAVLGLCSQVAVGDSFLLGPTGNILIANESAPWGAQVGLRMSI